MPTGQTPALQMGGVYLTTFSLNEHNSTMTVSVECNHYGAVRGKTIDRPSQGSSIYVPWPSPVNDLQKSADRNSWSILPSDQGRLSLLKIRNLCTCRPSVKGLALWHYLGNIHVSLAVNGTYKNTSIEFLRIRSSDTDIAFSAPRRDDKYRGFTDLYWKSQYSVSSFWSKRKRGGGEILKNH